MSHDSISTAALNISTNCYFIHPAATVTLLLSIAAKRMAKANVLVKDLQGVETLGALTVGLLFQHQRDRR